MKQLRNIIRFWLIDLANKIGGSDYYDFGSEVKGMSEHKGNLYIFTKESVFLMKDHKAEKLEVV